MQQKQVVGQYSQPTVPTVRQETDPYFPVSDPVTIGEALEASALGTGGDKPVDLSDAAAIQAAEVATGVILPGGIGAAAQSAATHNARTSGDEDKTTISDVLEVQIDNSSYLIVTSNRMFYFPFVFDNVVGIL